MAYPYKCPLCMDDAKKEGEGDGPCRACNGKGIVWEPPPPPPVEYVAPPPQVTAS